MRGLDVPDFLRRAIRQGLGVGLAVCTGYVFFEPLTGALLSFSTALAGASKGHCRQGLMLPSPSTFRSLSADLFASVQGKLGLVNGLKLQGCDSLDLLESSKPCTHNQPSVPVQTCLTELRSNGYRCAAADLQ